MKVIKSKLVIFLCLPPFFLLIVGSFPIQKEFEGICSRVLDGDTIIVAGRRIRLSYIDAPESSQYSYDGVKIGQMSLEYLKRRVEGKLVRVQFYHLGRYGRVLGVIFLDNEINLEMIKMGMAITYGHELPSKYRSAEYVARLRRRGLFGSIGFDRPSSYRKKVRYAEIHP